VTGDFNRSFLTEGNKGNEEGMQTQNNEHGTSNNELFPAVVIRCSAFDVPQGPPSFPLLPSVKKTSVKNLL
jgi:hypothetical protein